MMQPTPSLARTAVAVVLALFAAGCSDGTPGPGIETRPADSPSPSPVETPGTSVRPRFRPGAVRVDLETVAGGLDSPVGVTNASDGSGRLFVVEQGGRVMEINRERDRIGVFLDVSSRTSPGGERGLLGLAFHPRFEKNGRLFVNYTDLEGDTVIAEFTATDGDRADLGSERIVLTFDQPYANHNGGALAFGPDGMLYIASGDGGSGGDPEGNGQSLGTLLGKILRIDVDTGDPYAIPRDNPFTGEEGARPEIWATGLRNPWRMSFDRSTGDLWIGDVGQSAWEEIDVVPDGSGGGQNFGWSETEGFRCYREGCDPARFVAPIAAYSHDLGCSITGGHVYRGTRFPALTGGYFFGDYCSGNLWAMRARTSGRTRPVLKLESERSISSFGEDERGEIYATDLRAGELLQLVER